MVSDSEGNGIDGSFWFFLPWVEIWLSITAAEIRFILRKNDGLRCCSAIFSSLFTWQSKSQTVWVNWCISGGCIPVVEDNRILLSSLFYDKEFRERRIQFHWLLREQSLYWLSCFHWASLSPFLFASPVRLICSQATMRPGLLLKYDGNSLPENWADLSWIPGCGLAFQSILLLQSNLLRCDCAWQLQLRRTVRTLKDRSRFLKNFDYDKNKHCTWFSWNAAYMMLRPSLEADNSWLWTCQANST